ncbi:tyrosinase family protein [Sphingomonas sp. S1-29]|uniref:tyrosinase family protein n=1 Tax=Sphingomonas sp. S1-29 TaxID=2991074 RepID=UPI00223FA0FD|nr:tyrosinase family protein [Sphingomonas sp. S1-29]UZK70914.1 tyrosinase family protein [Sphingomonas sp. S1-29]
MGVGIRRSIADIQADYDSGNKTELENLMRAWRGIQALDPADLRSFFVLGGYHGEPFRGPGATDPSWWGGYCQHGTVLFPTWHRVYLHALERALQSIPGCESVMLPFWDECSQDSQANGIPRALTDEHFELDGVSIDNPLRSFTLPVGIVDTVQGDNALYSKPAGYETVRYPLSGLVGTVADQAATAAHNAKFPSYAANVKILNANIVSWLTSTIVIAGNPMGEVYSKFVACLNAPTYTLFSNTTSQGAWNNAHPTNPVRALESPHNSMHLAVGGFDIPGQGDMSPIDGANGDMGENDTAGLDPIFFFHHSFIDYVFWTWQRRNGATTSFTIDSSDPGAAYGANNPPPAGGEPDQPITMDTPLNPFTKPDGSVYTSNDCIDIETQLGYGYGPGSLDSYAHASEQHEALMLTRRSDDERTLHVAGVDRSKIRGSFLISAYAEVDGERRLLGHEAVLSRWHVEGCANCQTHLKASADFRLTADAAAQGKVEVEIRTRQGALGGGPRMLRKSTIAAAALTEAAEPFTLEIR